MKILVTGADGYLGRGLVEGLGDAHELRLMDVRAFESAHEVIVGSVADPAAVARAVEGVDAIVIAHMASRQAGSYETPVVPFDVNVKGTANLFFAACRLGVPKVALISSVGAVHQHYLDGTFLSRDLPLGGTDMYTLTKVCQEVVAEHYHRTAGVAVAVFRPAYIVYADTLCDKYGANVDVDGPDGWQLIDPRDLGAAARLALELDDLGYEIFYTHGRGDGADKAETDYALTRLGWRPKHTFSAN